MLLCCNKLSDAFWPISLQGSFFWPACLGSLAHSTANA